MSRRLRGFGLGSLVVILACQSATEPASPLGVPSSASLPGVQLRIAASASPSVIVAGQTLSLRYTITNVGRETAAVYFDCLGSAHRSLVLQSVTSRELIDKSPGCTPLTNAVLLAAGESTGTEVFIETTRPPSSPSAAATPLPAGRYVVDVTPSVSKVGLQSVQLQNLHAPFTVVAASR